MFRFTIGFLGLLMLAVSTSASEISAGALYDLAPTGKLRVGINFGNVALASKDPLSGEARGVVIDLGRELGRRIGVPVEIVAGGPEKLIELVKAGGCDVAFVAEQYARNGGVAFTAAHLEMEVGYLVQADSPLRTIADVDRQGVRIAVAARTPFDLFLSQNCGRRKSFVEPGTAAHLSRSLQIG